ncbi:tRNA (adenosine(37)-N6)-threonylcarbamoyltransferase complex dimerization subunit type 1 TsaB [Flavitalea sp.]|nr:tRNA (adenosine(37)-N6)-threonylcarbamoyltransferase complex dimerization subunit type 1 TsaB [Flavitalea sp.]
MALILNIDTSTEIASISIGNDGLEVGKLINTDQKDHASWIHEAILKLIAESSTELKQLQAIAVTAGPGSYTGIRVGMASAKGLAYALSIPLITENTLRVMAWSMVNSKYTALDFNPVGPKSSLYYAPMIDARREEVFTAVFDSDLSEIVPPIALKLDETAYADQLINREIGFFGSGSDKWKRLNVHQNAHFLKWDYAYFNLAYLSYQSYVGKVFADLAYVPPYYLKEVYTYKRN